MICPATSPTSPIAPRFASVLALLLALSLLGTAGAPGRADAQQSDWVLLKDAPPSVKLERAPWDTQSPQHLSHVHPDGSRGDWAFYGSLAEAAPNLAINIIRWARPQSTRTALTDSIGNIHDIKSRPRQFGSDYYALTTRFGELRAVSFMVLADGVQKSCLGFHRTGTSKLSLRGYYCSPEDARVDPNMVACLIDALRYVRAVDEEALAAIVGKAERTECAAAPIGGSREKSSSTGA
jgi:hypothetical protein